MTIHHRYAILLPLVTSMFAVLFVFSSPAHAMVVRGGEAYVVASGTTMVGDLYYLGKTFTLTGTSTDDLIAFGSVLTIDGRVGGDVLAVGGRVTTGGTVHGDLRIVGGEISVASTTVGEDLVALGGTFIIDKGTIIKGDLLVYGDQLVMNGTVEGNVEAHVRAVEIRGTVGHDTNITARESVSVTDQAHLRGALLYTAPREAFIPDTVKVDGKTSFELTPETKDEGTLNLVPTLITLLVTIVAALMFVFLLTRLSVEMSSVALRDHGMLAIKGFVLLLAWPLLGLVLCVTMAGIIPGLLLLTSYVIVVVGSIAFVPVLAGLVLARWLKKEDIIRWDWTILGAVCLFLIGFLPFIGFLVGFLLFVTTFGAFTFGLLAWIQAQQKPAVAPAVLPHDTTHADETIKPEQTTDTSSTEPKA